MISTSPVLMELKWSVGWSFFDSIVFFQDKLPLYFYLIT